MYVKLYIINYYKYSIMASHNTGKINWNIIHQNIKWTKESNINRFILLDNNIKPINFLSKQILNVIKDFSITPEKNRH